MTSQLAHLAHEIFLLSLNLSRVQDEKRLLDLFLDAMNGSFGDTRFRLLRDGESFAGESVEIRTATASYGRIAVEGSPDTLVAGATPLFRNAVAMAAILLERVRQRQMLEADRQRLEDLVAIRTTELREANRALDARNRIAEAFLTNRGEEVFSTVLLIILGLVEGSQGVFAVVSPDGAVTEAASIASPDGSRLDCVQFLEGDRDGRPRVVTGACGPCVVVPLRSDGHTLGFFAAAKPDTAFSASETEALTEIGRFIAPVLDARLMSEKKERDRSVAEAALRESSIALAEAQRLARLGSWTFDLATGELLWSAELRRIFDVQPDEPATPALFLSRVHPDDRDGTVEHILRLQATEPGPVDAEFRVVRSGGEIRHVHAVGTLQIHSGRHMTVGTVQDITERKLAEAERAKLEEQVRQAQKLESLGRLAGGVAHDFNNLLTVINGYCDLLLAHTRNGDANWMPLSEIGKAGELASSLTQQLLMFGRKHVIQPRSLNPNAVIRESERMLRRLLTEDIELVTTLDPSLGNVLADTGQLQQVLMNLILNARDAMPRGGRIHLETQNLEVSVSQASEHPGLSAGPYVLLCVTDNGAGMDRETLDRIFEPFFTTKGEGKGTGLGLSTVYGIVRQCGGWIWVYSEPGLGTTFKIYLPRIGAVAPAGPSEPRLCGKPRVPATILIVEDQHNVRKFAAAVLEQEGYRVLLASNGTEALELAAAFNGPIHLLLTDVVMPGITGKDLADSLKQTRGELAVVFMSGYTEDVISSRGVLDAGINFLSKPFSPAALCRKVRDGLG